VAKGETRGTALIVQTIVRAIAAQTAVQTVQTVQTVPIAIIVLQQRRKGPEETKLLPALPRTRVASLPPATLLKIVVLTAIITLLILKTQAIQLILKISVKHHLMIVRILIIPQKQMKPTLHPMPPTRLGKMRLLEQS